MAQYHRTPELSVSSVFKLRPEELELFFLREHQKMPENQGERRECLTILEKVDWQEGLLKCLATDAETGIIGDVKDIKRRQKFFGDNKHSLPKVRSFWAILWDQFDEPYVIILLILGTISLVLSFFQGIPWKWLESVSIYFAVIFAGLIQTFCDWGKEKQFLRLQDEIMNEQVVVLRGQYGTSQTIYVKDLVVGDIVLLQQGDRVPADCLLIEEMDMRVDQSMFFTDDADVDHSNAEKQCSNLDRQADIEKNPDPVLLQDSIVKSGSGKAVVLACGKHSLKEKDIAEELEGDKYALQIEKEMTPFQQKLETLAQIIGAWARTITLFTSLVFGLVWFLSVVFGDYDLVSSESINRAIELACTAVAILIVCIPEGMPLVISMAMAFSVDTLKQENLLIKNLSALELCGEVIDIMAGKTATLTTGDMEVARINIEDRTQDAVSIQANQACLKLLYECIILNTDAHMQMKEERYEPVGSPVDVGLLNFIGSQGNLSVQELMIEREREYGLKLWIPFSADRKCMTVAYRLKDNPDVVRLVMKGAPEVVVRRCSNRMDNNQDPEPFNNHDQYLTTVVEEQIILGPDYQSEAMREDAGGRPTGLKAITFAYKDFSTEEFDAMVQANNKFEAEADRAKIENGLIMVATIGLMDPLREDIGEAVLKLSDGGTNIRLFSGDNKMALLQTAVQIGVIDSIEDDNLCFDGAEVLAKLEQMMYNTVEKRQQLINDGLMEEAERLVDKPLYEFQNRECRNRFKKELKNNCIFVYRTSPKLKHMFACALKQSNSTIAVTGEGFSDRDALREAHVGFTMGQDGCSAAKDAADIILTQDDFNTVVAAIRWGRNMQENVRKFVQYQITVNISCLIFVISTSCILAHPPFNVVQLLWINLIMDVLAAIAFATENPHPTDIRRERVHRKDPILIPTMWRSILSQSVYQLLAMILILYVGPAAGGFEYNFYNTELTNPNGTSSYRELHQTFMFQCFVMMNLFNMVNCRIVDAMPQELSVEESGIAEQGELQGSRPDFNIFKQPFSNMWFWIVLFAELNIQYAMIGYEATGAMFSTTPITLGMHLTAVFLGLGSWGLAALMKISSPKLLSYMPKVGEDKQALEDTIRRTSAATAALDVRPGETKDGDDFNSINEEQ